MQQIELTVEEAEVLRDVLRHQVAEMEVEVGRTDTRDFKAMLKHRRDILQHVLGKVSSLAMAA